MRQRLDNLGHRQGSFPRTAAQIDGVLQIGFKASLAVQTAIADLGIGEQRCFQFFQFFGFVPGAMEVNRVDQQRRRRMVGFADNGERIPHRLHRGDLQKLQCDPHPAGRGPLAQLMQSVGCSPVIRFRADDQNICGA